ncbi:MAG: PepSY-associated TM helix domain-containing protein [Bacteroidota bacterium]
MKLSKKVFFKIHRWIGIKLSILFFVVCFSGSLATLSHEMDWLSFPEIRAEYHGEYASHNKRVANIRKAYPEGKIAYWAASNEPYLCDIAQVVENGQRYYVFTNPYTGEVQGSATLTFQRFFRDLHYFLFIPFQVGHFTVLIFGFMLLISMVTALLFYKKWWKKLFKLRIGKGRLAFFRSLHSLVGLWSVPFAILFSITGIWYFIERTNIGGVAKIANTRSPKLEAGLDSAVFATISYDIDYDKAVQVAEKTIPGLKVKDILPPSRPERVLYINGISDVPLVRNRANRIFLHPLTFEVIGIQEAKNLPVVTWLNDIADPLHFGYWGGIVTKIIWFIGGMAISGLVLTGIWVALKRTAHYKKPKRKTWAYVNYLFTGLMLFFMYGTLITRYSVSSLSIIIISVIMVTMAVWSWYIFDYKFKKKYRPKKKVFNSVS